MYLINTARIKNSLNCTKSKIPIKILYYCDNYRFLMFNDTPSYIDTLCTKSIRKNIYLYEQMTYF